MSNEVPDYIYLDLLLPVQPGERIMDHPEIAHHVGPIYDAANLSDDSTQKQRHAVFVAALERAIGSGMVMTPRSHPELGWCLATRYDPPVSCRPVLAGGPDDITASCGGALN